MERKFRRTKFIELTLVCACIALLFFIFYIFNNNRLNLVIRNNDIYLEYNYDGKTNIVKSQKINADSYFHIFAPSFYNLEEIKVTSNDYFIEDGYYYNGEISFTKRDDASMVKIVSNDKKTIIIHQLSNDSLFIQLEDSYKLDDIKNDKELKVKANVLNINSNGETIFNGETKHIKGRGNSSWANDKKSYSLSFDSAISLQMLPTSKKYVLIPSYFDMTGMRNKLIYDFASSIQLEKTPKADYVNVFVNGEYQGLYLLSTKVSASENNDSYSDTTKTEEKSLIVKKDNIGELQLIKYFDNNQSNKFDTYLIEKDWNVYFDNDTSNAGFVTKSGNCYKIHDSRNMSYEDVLYIATLFQKFENSLFDLNSLNYINMIDIDSWVKRYLIEEISQNHDAGLTSCYYYVKKDDPIIYAGPVWDYDRSMGSGRISTQNPNILNLAYKVSSNFDEENVFSTLTYRSEFMEMVKDYFYQNIYPNINALIYGDTEENARRIKDDMYLNALRYGQNRFIVNNDQYKEYNYDYSVQELQGHLYEHVNYMYDVYKNLYNYKKVILHTKNYFMLSICFLVKQGDSFTSEHEVPYYSSGNGFVWPAPLWISKWVDKDGNEFDFDKPITEDIELYAVWEGDVDGGAISK